MGYLLRIVEGPNRGAEIALVEGVMVSLGKNEDCDIILADATLPDAPLQIEAAADGVSLEAPGKGREHLEPYHVVTFGSTSFAVGASDSAWPSLVWPKKDEPKSEETAETAPAPAKPTEEKKSEEKPKDAADKDEKKKGGWLLWLIGVVLLIIILAVIAWLFRGKITALAHGENDEAAQADATPEVVISPLDAVVEKYALVKHEEDGRVSLCGDFATRAERLAATAEAYAALPGVGLDFADAQSLKAAVEETLTLVGEKDVEVSTVSNRIAVLRGSAVNLRRTLDAIAADVPKLSSIDCNAVAAAPVIASDDSDGYFPTAAKKAQAAKNIAQGVNLPVCGILTTPYPCLVLQNGMRIFEGAPLVGDSVVVKIEPDAVTITNASGRITWRP